MNYRHAFHAGNFADVAKHAVLTRILLHLRAKLAPFRVIDTHAGAGRYDLTGSQAQRGGEWQIGIGALVRATLGEPARGLLAPYLDAVAGCNADGRLEVYPGSPALARAFLRDQDRLVACELEPGAAASLKHEMREDRRVKVVTIDGWTALNAYVPPNERRGLVLIDPAYEEPDDFAKLMGGLAAAHRKWASGIYLLWYPIKTRAGPDALARQLRRSGIADILRAELEIPPADPARLAGCGLVVVNPPWTLESELHAILPALAAILSGGRGGAARVDRVVA